MVYDGINSEPQNIDISINNGKIIYLRNKKQSINADKIIDAEGLIVSPGFIDTHTHSDRDLNNKETSHNLPFLKQGITTVVVGNDGDSYFPISDYKSLYESQGIGTNVVMLVGNGTIRNKVLGNINKKQNLDELSEMKKLINQTYGLFYQKKAAHFSDKVKAVSILLLITILALVIFLKLA